ncbi:IS630 family transposase [Microcoleus vaginatus]|uniref:IS630 family transposase n=1 Tax=Microcoleus vaginatus TaxID=119532 RepID=UPI001F61790D|nr:IS630 family transposase [Microcoleus vaginatus HSN003]UNU25719.1 IS630 family transposase [Microcoleus vaginatus HSN003]
MPKPYSYDLRQKVIQAIKLDGLKISEASVLFGISRDTIRLWLKRERETGDFQALPNKPPGNGHKITDWGKFTKFVEVNGDKTQVEMAQLWSEEISDRTISRALKKIGFTRKKTYGYQERNEIKRAEFREEIVVYKPEEIVYIDEAGMDNRENYSYGWNERGQRFYDLKSGRRQGRINMIAGFCNGQLLAPFTVEGSCNRTVFETWLEACLIPTLKPGQILIVDNATFHKGGNIIQLIEAAGCQLKYLPSYSPDLNKIERCWSWLKSRIRKQLTQYGCLRDAMEAVLRTAA